ncbi:DUF4412 domain-containing protein [Algoriphagus boritolerans]|uniref:DUF4412 domain-containing protein n=1 Tax=Algoriphagus boritolerans DSM 17298 = JCM 18970 TaxID=1120964 RepID=A0A1H5Y8N6_9BACT|nr:DUF4412 domain-containing protein [Algoriphagus boritolerans]SEG20017.1 protein of unknown function [Algoriphagus boritolerans DSM 17298 = JCM 18970]
MKKSISSILILAGIVVASPSQAQLLKKIQNAAAQGVENAATKRARDASEKKTNDAIDGMIGGMIKPAPTESEYAFTGYMVMEVRNTDKKGRSEDPVKMQYLLSDNLEFMGMSFADPKSPENSTTSIIDTKNEAIVMLMENKGEKSSMAIRIDHEKMQGMVDKEVEKQRENPEYKITKTGNTKTILGYQCEEYLITSEDGEGHYWVTEKPIEGLSLFSPQSNPMVSNKTMDQYSSMFSNAPKGSFLEMIFTDKKGTVTEMKVIEIETNSPRKYNMDDFPNMMAGAGK